MDGLLCWHGYMSSWLVGLVGGGSTSYIGCYEVGLWDLGWLCGFIMLVVVGWVNFWLVIEGGSFGWVVNGLIVE